MISITHQFLRKKLSYPNLKGGKVVLNNSTTKRQIKHWSNKLEEPSGELLTQAILQTTFKRVAYKAQNFNY